MKKLRSLTRLITAPVVASLLILSCKKEASHTLSAGEEEQVAVFSTESELESQLVFDDIFNNVMGVNSDVGLGDVGVFGRTMSNGGAGQTDSLPPCATVSITPLQPLVFPKTVVIDFGAGCLSHGHLRSGRLITVYSGRLIEPGQSATTTFEDFKIDSLSIEGTQKITNTTAAGANQRQFETEITNARLSAQNGDYAEWNATRLITQTEGTGTIPPADDVLHITGSSNGKTQKGDLLVSWTSEIREPLTKAFTCRWLSKGTIETVRNGLPSGTPWAGTLDFGDGTCDNKATLTVNGTTHQITLH